MLGALAMNEDLHSDSDARVPCSEPDRTSTDDLRSRRLTLFICIAAVGSFCYTLNDALRECYWTAALHGMAAACQGAARYQQVKRKNIDQASHWLLISMFFSIGTTTLFDGNFRAPGLWFIPVLPVAASLLFGKRAVAWYTLGVVAVIFVHLLANPFIPPDELVTRHPEQWMQLRVATLLVFAGLSLASGTASRNARKQIARRTQELELEAERANVAERSKSTILATMSHEIRMPMQGVLALIQEHGNLGFDKQFNGVFDAMRERAQRVLRLLDALLDLANLQSGQAQLQEKNFALGALLERVHLKHEKLAKSKGITLRTQMSVGPRTFLGDAQRIYQLVSALVNNAIKFSEGGEIEILAQIELQHPSISQQKRNVIISVRDQGIGMNAEQLSRIFGRFAQVHDDLAAHQAGWGLGLAIADQLARSMRGTLEASSEPGKGSTFTLTLPLQEDRLLAQSWSEFLPIDELHPAESLEASTQVVREDPDKPEQKDNSVLKNLTAVMLPLILITAALELRVHNTQQAAIHALCLLTMGWSSLPSSKNSKNWHALAFLVALALSMTSQALMEGTIQSEGLWSICLIPVLTAFLFSVKASFLVLGLTVALFVHLLDSPSTPFEVTYFGHGTFATLALRLASLCAYAGTSFAISKSDISIMTELQRQQRSVDRIREEAVASNREKDRFLARIRREMGAPIQHIMDFANKAQEHQGLDVQQRGQLGAIQSCAGQIGQLLSRSIDYAVDDQTQHEIKAPVVFELRELLLDTCRVFSPSATRKDRFIQFVDKSENSRVQGDPAGIFEVVAVLLTHAIRTGLPGPVYLHLTQRSPSSAGMLAFEIKVRCAGLSIAPSQRDLLASQSPSLETEASMHEFGHDPVLRGLVAAKTCGGSIALSKNPSNPGLVFKIELPQAAKAEPQAA